MWKKADFLVQMLVVCCEAYRKLSPLINIRQVDTWKMDDTDATEAVAVAVA